MATPEQLAALKELYEQAVMSQHIWPEMAACEAALESAWLTSELARDYNNLFGQKKSNEEQRVVWMPTQEVHNGHTFNIRAAFVWYPAKTAAFTARMALLERLQDEYPEYKAALHASTPEEYISSVSRRWSTDPDRAEKVLAIYRAHKDVMQ